ncbi:hypothetical protein AMJ47_01225 [Parcubacteria bacterium DG_72]|nr:MAG: hypothetical protein AMJ47_01225 [Parcubacteria bacterium DG_72]
MNIKEEILKILPKPADQIKVAYIITASKSEKDISYLDRDKGAMLDLGFSVEEIDIGGKNEKELKEIFKDKDIIYVQGGNTFYLLKYVKESGFGGVIKDLIERGKIYIGVSAGSIITGPTIETAGWKRADKNIVGLKDLTGLNFVPFLVFVHYEPEHSEIVKQERLACKYPVRILTDEQAFLVRDNEIKLVGNGPEVKI